MKRIRASKRADQKAKELALKYGRPDLLPLDLRPKPKEDEVSDKMEKAPGPGDAIVLEPAEPQALASVPVEDLAGHVAKIQAVMSQVMRKGHHYGKIQGCGPKPTLLKPGAEVVCMTFQIALADLQVEDLSTDDAVRYRVKTIGQTPDGVVRGVGIGEASSDEAKYRWRAAVSDEEWDATPASRRRVKYARDSRYNKRQVRTDPSDHANTVLKMAKKRAFVDLTLTATAASDVFTQDLEDLPAEARERPREPRSAPPPQTPTPRSNAPERRGQAPQRGRDEPPHPADMEDSRPGPGVQAAQRAAAKATGRQVVGVIEEVSEKTGQHDDGHQWVRHGVKIGGEWYGTFSETLGQIALEASGTGEEVVLIWEQRGKYKNLVDLIREGEQAAPPPGPPVDDSEIPF